MSRTEEQLLGLATSDSWSDRADAARQLSASTTPAAREAMRTLISDSTDTAVMEAALDGLVAQGDAESDSVIFKAVATLDEDGADHLLFFMQNRWAALEASGLRDRAITALSDDDPTIREGARTVLSELGWLPTGD